MQEPSSAELAILTTYYDFNSNPWMRDNTSYCLQHWRNAGAYVILVELALSTDGSEYAFAPKDGLSLSNDDDETPLIADAIVGCRVQDIMWYKEAALNIALTHVPAHCSLVGWFDNDILFASNSEKDDASNQWVRTLVQTFKQNPLVHFVQPFSEIAFTTESIRNELIGQSINEQPDETKDETKTETKDETKTEDETSCSSVAESDCHSSNSEDSSLVTTSTDTVISTCRKIARVRNSIMANGGKRHSKTGNLLGVTGCAWVARRALITKLRFFEHAIVGGGNDVQLNLWLGATGCQSLPVVNNQLQQWYFGEGRNAIQAGLRRVLLRYRKRIRAYLSIQPKCAYLPLSVIHLYHGELATPRTATERFGYLMHRQFRASIHLQSHRQYSELLTWTDSFRDTSLQNDLKRSFERSQTVREKTLQKLGRIQQCIRDAHGSMQDIIQLQTHTGVREKCATNELVNAMQDCLQAFDKVTI